VSGFPHGGLSLPLNAGEVQLATDQAVAATGAWVSVNQLTASLGPGTFLGWAQLQVIATAPGDVSARWQFTSGALSVFQGAVGGITVPTASPASFALPLAPARFIVTATATMVVQVQYAPATTGGTVKVTNAAGQSFGSAMSWLQVG
jgi:hypothetical protein